MLDERLREVRRAQAALAGLSPFRRRECLVRISAALLENEKYLLTENQKDIITAQRQGLSDAMVERLTLSEERIKALADSVVRVADLEDAVGQVLECIDRPNGLRIEKVSVPFGVVAVIFESRPNVCVDIAVLCLKTANACVLRGGKEALRTNMALVQVMKKAISPVVDSDCIFLIEDTDRKTTDVLLTKRELIDVLIPRGGRGLIQYVIENSKIPSIETGAGNCHLYVHEAANLTMALSIAVNAKYQRPSVCNSIETILVDRGIAPVFLPMLKEKFDALHIEIRGSERVRSYISCVLAQEEDFYTEYNDYIVAVEIVGDIKEAVAHIERYSSKHSESIITEDCLVAERFLDEVDSACVYHNASTRFTDGGEFGYGAEIGISTQKLHARGPMGLRELCTYKYKIYGSGQVRK